ncbi:hypothetical protein HU200_038948 [Digitaria exilis]|uniref:NAD-dependent epimerase/dehydratase domain-containing protein n=1 Tax=Digitaria exilis TaxID=1010633 RepID=A0A835BJN4_9POAL|nr:hypothetical protein HU200_038948 [Digitaria exilis]
MRWRVGKKEGKGETVMVTGASGFIGSTLVRRLLDRGYNVLNPGESAHRNPTKPAAMLWPLASDPGGERLTTSSHSPPAPRLRIFRCNLFDGAARGCLPPRFSSPCIVDAVSDPQVPLPTKLRSWSQRQLIVPAVEGTLNVLRAAMDAGGVRRVVVTSSNSAIIPSPEWPAGEVRDERFWTDIDYCEKIRSTHVPLVRYHEINKTLKGHHFGPGHAGCTEEYMDIFMGAVHVEDVALAHILVFENPSASGRHLCIQSISHWSDLAAKIAELYPNYKVPKFPKDTQPGLARAEVGSKKLIALGLQISPLEKIIRDAVESLRTRGYIL